MGEQRGGTKKKKEEVDERGIVAAAYRAYMHYKGCAQKFLRMVRNCGGKGVGDGGEKKPDEELNRKGEEIRSGKEERKSEETEDEKVEKERSPPVEKGETESKMSEQGHEGKREKKKSEKPHVSTTVLKTRLHCGRCARRIKKIISKHANGLQEVNMNLEKNQITLKGTVDIKELLPYLTTRLKQNVEVVLLPEKKDDGDSDTRPEGGSGGGEEVKDGGGENKRKKKGEKRGSKPKDVGGGDGSNKSGENVEHYHPNRPTEPDDPTVGDPNQSCAPASGGGRHSGDGYGQGDIYGYGGIVYQQPPPPGYPPNHHQGSDAEYYYAPPLHFFSDENPNSCSVM